MELKVGDVHPYKSGKTLRYCKILSIEPHKGLPIVEFHWSTNKSDIGDRTIAKRWMNAKADFIKFVENGQQTLNTPADWFEQLTEQKDNGETSSN